MERSTGEKFVVIGAGPVGALAALYAARRGNDVDVYELRSDLRDPSTTPLNFTKSINLALSERGINSLRATQCPSLLDSILSDTIPMHGRMIHARRKGSGDLFEESQKYDVHGRFIRAADRAGLNKRLLDELESMPNVTLHFNHKLTGADFKRNKAWFEVKPSAASANAGKIDPYSSGGDADNDVASKSQNHDRPEEIEVSFDFMIGADGAHSASRYHMMKYARMNYEQEYIDTLWCEFTIQATDDNTDLSSLSATARDGFRLSPNHLHIWPAGSFMFIAIPSLDKSFTCTLFMPASRFAELDTALAQAGSKTTSSSPVVDFFNQNFPGVVPNLIASDDITAQYKQNPHLPLISIKCSPYHYGSSVVILGDAAHAMVPFYGQGMNAGLEDVRVLFEQLDAHNPVSQTGDQKQAAKQARAKALEAYTAIRSPDAHSINDLAMANYTEMRSSVRSPLYLLRKSLEETLDAYMPSLGVVTQYARVSFSNQRYSEVVKDVKWQGEALEGLGMAVGVLGVAAVGLGAWWRFSSR